MDYTQEQKDIFDFVKIGSGHGIIDAVAGAGKTTTIMEAARHVEDKHSILFCAFNNSIMREIARKFHQKGMNEVSVMTIHALGRQILHANNNTGRTIKLENLKYRTLLESPEMREAISPHYKAIANLNFPPELVYDKRNEFALKNLIKKIDRKLLNINQKYRATLTKDTIEDFEQMLTHFNIFNSIEVRNKNFKLELEAYYESHKLLLAAGNSLSKRKMIIDFTDMLYLPFAWKLSPIRKYEFLFIDECQDLSKSQFAVAAKYGKKGGRILAVGDPTQSIYGFTGADIESFDRIKAFTKALQLPLTTCFRCPKKVIEIARDIREDIAGNKQEDGRIHHIKIEEVIKLAKPNDLIICRFKAPLVILVFNFIDQNIKIQVHEDEAQGFINELKNIFKMDELNAVLGSIYGGFFHIKSSVLKRWNYIIQKKAKRIKDSAERNLFIKNETAYLENKLDFIYKKCELWKGDCATIYEVLKRIKAFISVKKDAIRLSSIHRAKGLEEDRVFIVDYDELPYFQMGQKEWERVQEVNLKYVAVTRAKKELFLVESVPVVEMEEEGSLFDDFPF